MDISLHNTLSGKKEKFEPLEQGVVKMYHCGPTVYNFPSIGNMRSYVLADILRKNFEYFGYNVKQAVNITDVGHLVGDRDEGEDKVEKEAKRKGKTVKEIARFNEDAFREDLASLNIKTEGTNFPRASEHIAEQIEIIKSLEEKGFTYHTSDGVYFDTSKYPDYGKLGNINLAGLKEGVRVEKGEKRNSTDFALWKFSSDKKRLQEWQSPWGPSGFPGWHIECSAMSRKYLGQPFDIHTGGIDHIPVHHNNEIAQSECAYGVPLAHFWLHNEFLKIDGEKMSKSLGNIFTLEDLKKRKIHPLSFRYFLLSGHYRSPMNFTWKAVEGAQNVLEKLISTYLEIPAEDASLSELIAKFEKAMSDDLNTAVALATLQEARSKNAVDKIDQVLGLNIKNLSEQTSRVPEGILEIKSERDKARSQKDWQKSDKLREEIESQGYILEDQGSFSTIRKTLASLC